MFCPLPHPVALRGSRTRTVSGCRSLAVSNESPHDIVGITPSGQPGLRWTPWYRSGGELPLRAVSCTSRRCLWHVSKSIGGVRATKASRDTIHKLRHSSGQNAWSSFRASWNRELSGTTGDVFFSHKQTRKWALPWLGGALSLGELANFPPARIFHPPEMSCSGSLRRFASFRDYTLLPLTRQSSKNS